MELQSGNPQFGLKSTIFVLWVLEIWWMTLKNNRAPPLCYVKLCIAIGEFKLELQPGNAQFGWKSTTFCPVWPWNFADYLKNNRTALLCCFKLCASFHNHRWIQTGVTVRKRPIRVKIDDFFVSCVNLKFYRWPLKPTRHLSYVTPSFVHNFIAICEYKLLQSGKD